MIEYNEELTDYNNEEESTFGQAVEDWINS